MSYIKYSPGNGQCPTQYSTKHTNNVTGIQTHDNWSSST